MRVEHEGADADRRGRAPACAAYEPAHARDELDDLERLAEIIVRAGLDARDLLGPVVAGRNYDHREQPVFVAPAAQHRKTVDARQAEIQDGDVVVFRVS